MGIGPPAVCWMFQSYAGIVPHMFSGVAVRMTAWGSVTLRHFLARLRS
jgi:hypothetical protein